MKTVPLFAVADAATVDESRKTLYRNLHER